MQDFQFYLIEGWHHIISADALDHQLFILALAIIYLPKDWKKVLILVTAFTIGHSLTLALSALDVVRIPVKLVEFFIPLTIAATALWNILRLRSDKKIYNNYYLALLFGLVHGLGFANTIRMILPKDGSLITALLGFNTGLELGQIAVVSVILCITKFLADICKIPSKIYIFVASAIILCIALYMAFTRWPF